MANKNKSSDLTQIHEFANDLNTKQIQNLLEKSIYHDIRVVEQKIADLESEYDLGIGLRLDIQKICDILNYMVSNNKSTITLKYEVWHSPQQNTQPNN